MYLLMTRVIAGAQAGQVGAAVTLGMLLVKQHLLGVASFHCMATSTPMCVPGMPP